MGEPFSGSTLTPSKAFVTTGPLIAADDLRPGSSAEYFALALAVGVANLASCLSEPEAP